MKSFMKYNEVKVVVVVVGVCVQRFNTILFNKTVSQQILETVLPPMCPCKCTAFGRPLIKLFLKPRAHLRFNCLKPGTLRVFSSLFFFDTVG